MPPRSVTSQQCHISPCLPRSEIILDDLAVLIPTVRVAQFPRVISTHDSPRPHLLSDINTCCRFATSAKKGL